MLKNWVRRSGGAACRARESGIHIRTAGDGSSLLGGTISNAGPVGPVNRSGRPDRVSPRRLSPPSIRSAGERDIRAHTSTSRRLTWSDHASSSVRRGCGRRARHTRMARPLTPSPSGSASPRKRSARAPIAANGSESSARRRRPPTHGPASPGTARARACRDRRLGTRQERDRAKAHPAERGPSRRPPRHRRRQARRSTRHARRIASPWCAACAARWNARSPVPSACSPTAARAMRMWSALRARSPAWCGRCGS